MKKAFEIDLRSWSIAEIRESMLMAGFKKVELYISGKDEDGEATDFVRIDASHALDQEGDDWNAYVIGIK